MKTLIIGAGPLGSLYASLLNRSGKDVILLARNNHYHYLKKNGIVMINEFTQEKIIERVNLINSIQEEDAYDLAIILMRKNNVKMLLPVLGKCKNIQNLLFMGNNAQGFGEYLDYLPREKVLFGFPGGGGSRIDHIVHYIDSEKPNGRRMPITIGEMDGKVRRRTRQIQDMFNTSGVQVHTVKEIDSWLKYHVAFINPLAGALLKSGDNYRLAKDNKTLSTYIKAVQEGGKVLKSLGWTKSYNFKFNMFYWMPAGMLMGILRKVFSSKFAEVAMMMHVKSARDEMIELGNEFKSLRDQSGIETPNLDELMHSLNTSKTEEIKTL